MPATQEKYAINLSKLRRYAELRGSFIYVPIMAAYVQTHLLSPSFVTQLYVVTQGTSFFFEIVTGFIADRRSRKLSLVLGALFCAVSMVMFTQADSRMSFIWAAVVLGLGQSFMIGADTSVLYETITRLNAPRYGQEYANKLYQRVNTFVRGHATGSEAACSIAAGLLIAYGGVNYRGILFLQVVLYVAAAAVALGLYDKERPAPIPFKQMLRTAFTKPRILAVMLFSGAAGGLSGVLVWWTAPFFIEVLKQPRLVGLSPDASFNLVWALFLGSVPFWGWLLHKFVERVPVTSVWVMITLAACSYAMIMFKPGLLAFLLIGLTYLVRSSIIPAADRLLNQLIENGERATINSIGRCVMLLISVIIYAVSSVVAEAKQSVIWGIGVAGVTIVTLTIALFLWVLYLGAHRHSQSA